MPKKQKQIIPERRPDQGDDYVLLIDSPYWPPGTVLQLVMKDWWYGRNPIAEFQEGCKSDRCTILVIQRAPEFEGRTRYLTSDEAKKALKVRGLLSPERAKYLSISSEGEPIFRDLEAGK